MHQFYRSITLLLSAALISFAAPACDDALDNKAKPTDKQAGAKASPQTPAAGEQTVVEPPTSVNAALTQYSDCHSECHVKHSGDNLETCKLNCGAAAKTAYSSIEPQPDKTKYDAALEDFRTCASTCDADTSRTTNMHTCYLNCKNAAQVKFAGEPNQ